MRDFYFQFVSHKHLQEFHQRSRQLGQQEEEKKDPTTFAEDFLHFLLEGNVKFAVNGLSKDECLDANGLRSTPSVVTESIQEFVGKIMTFIEKGIESIDCVIDGDYATVRFSVRWTGLMAGTLTKKTFSGTACLKMKRSTYAGWDVVQAIVPGWNA
jgi:hypothetical protein